MSPLRKENGWRPSYRARGEAGFALVTVLTFTAVLMAVMTMMLNTTMIETLMSGASTVSKKTLAVADSGVEYVRGTFVLIGNSFPSSSSTGNYTSAVQTQLPSSLGQKITFLNMSSMGADSSLLAGSGFSAKYVSTSSGGGALKFTPYRSRTTSTAVIGTSRKTVEFEGFNLAP
ncbi:pilus assembly PilX N-terminal domain-containing protein [Geobacter sp.]|uniref:pilus assembly PilX N-terminal domain-containing protein n=1 Tax=Geobacter sp. TaxID=46610 RepID=UPI002608C25F|nr:pilus assembly PilX N-terminal domain-containing protein [Geobacter sp.]